jgi:hypothetical protein
MGILVILGVMGLYAQYFPEIGLRTKRTVNHFTVEGSKILLSKLVIYH